MRALGLRMVSCLGLAAATLTLAAPAVGDDLTKVDDTADVRLYQLPDRPRDPLVVTEVPRRRDGDLRRAHVRYGERRIRVVMRFLELRRHEPVVMIQGRLRWPERGQLDYGEAVITATEANRAGRARFTTRPGCQVRHKVRYDENRASMSFPARCIGSPRWIQFNAATFAMDDENDPSYAYIDSIFTIVDEDDDGSVERFTRRVPRG